MINDIPPVCGRTEQSHLPASNAFLSLCPQEAAHGQTRMIYWRESEVSGRSEKNEGRRGRVKGEKDAERGKKKEEEGRGGKRREESRR